MNLKLVFRGFVQFLLFFFLTFACQNASQPLHTAQSSILNTEKPYFPLLSTYSSQEDMQIVDAMLEEFRQQWLMEGISVAIVKDGRLVYAKGFGYADKARNVKVEPHHLFRIASVSKLFTAVGIMRLVEQGKLKLNDKVFGKNGLLPQYTQFIQDTLAYQIEVEHLLTHTAGWRNQLRTDPMFVPVLVADIMKVKSPPSFETTVQYMLSQNGMFEPGSLYDYSNFGYCLLGKIIEQKTGKSYENYMQSEILNPLNIKRMRIGKNRYQDRLPNEVRYYDHPKAERNLSIYNPKDSASRVYEGTNTEALGAAGGWIASPVDLLRFLVAIDGFSSKPDILQANTIARMTKSGQPKDSSTHQHLLGWKQVDEEKWWRTGSLSSTGISLTRRHDGISWAIVTNTGSWRGPFFSYEIEGVMRRILQRIKQFPDYDLFELAE